MTESYERASEKNRNKNTKCSVFSMKVHLISECVRGTETEINKKKIKEAQK